MLKQIPLIELHQKLNAKLAPFAGYNMPLNYSSIADEINAVRKNCGVFDVSHMGEFFVSGRDAVNFVDSLIPNNFKTAAVGKAVYSPLCNNEGRILDDLIAYKISDNEVLICVNASNIEKDWNWISSLAAKSKLQFELKNESQSYCLLALQGPKSEKILKSLMPELPLEQMSYYSVYKQESKTQVPLILARTGYTGEDGFEIFCSSELAAKLWQELIKAGVTPCGLVSRDVLRLEACYPLYGKELSEEVDPKECNLNWTISKLDKEYVGKLAIKNNPIRTKLIKLVLETGVPRENYKVFQNGHQIGHVTSGTFSTTLNQGIAIARVDAKADATAGGFQIEVRNNKVNANYSVKPFYQGELKK
jgi:aminomethyltransferase